ncbi:MAG: HAD family phosphatase [Firmicutes bacterium]|jgi:phosphoglycolate phosphatase-like HAD superfamily hydrolase|nr:HAD family phosphatase [Bacillota bacterium]
MRKRQFGGRTVGSTGTGWSIEVIRDDVTRGQFKAALFDFDGTVSLIRQGWQEVMVPYFTELLLQVDREASKEQTACYVRDFVDELTGKQTIYQCIRLAEEIRRRGGQPLDPLEYKNEYHRRLLERIDHRLQGLKDGRIAPDELLVPGVLDFLTALRSRGIKLYLASGTDEVYVLAEAELLGVSAFFDGGIYGALDQYHLFSKAKVIERMIAEHKLAGPHLLGVGDGFVEIENVKAVGGFAVGLASDELHREGVDLWKRERLIRAGADIIIPDFSQTQTLMEYLFP